MHSTYIFQLNELKQLLETKYKYKFDEVDEDDESESPLDAGVIDYKSKYEDAIL